VGEKRRALLVRTIQSFLGRSGRLAYAAPRKSVGIDIPMVATAIGLVEASVWGSERGLSRNKMKEERG
jgi:hypothetical protein